MDVLSPEQRCVLATAGLLHELNRDSHELIGGALRPAGSGKAMYLLGSGWDILTAAQVDSTLRWLAAEGHRKQFAADAHQSEESLLAFDYTRIAAVAGWAYLVYWLDRDAAWEWIRSAAAVVAPAFRSFRQFGDSYIRGLELWCEGDPRIVGNAKRALDSLCARPDSPFRLPWDTQRQCPAPVPQTGRVELQPAQSIAQAIEQAGPCGRVVLGPGDYRESLRPRHAIELVAREPGRTTLHAARALPCLWLDPRVGAYLNGLKLQAGSTASGESLNAVHAIASFAHLEQCELVATHHGVALLKDCYLHLVDCSIHDCGRSGIEANPGTPVVVGGDIARCGLDGIGRWGAESEGLRAVVQDCRISRAARHGVVANGDCVLRGVRVEGAGEVGLLVGGCAEAAEVAVIGSQGWGAVVDDHGLLQGSRLRIEGSGNANLQVVDGTARLEDSHLVGAMWGVTLQSNGCCVLERCALNNHADGHVTVLEGARAIATECKMRGGKLGIWTAGWGRFDRCAVEETLDWSLQVQESAHAVFTDCRIEGSGAGGVYLAEKASALLARCSIQHCADAGIELEAQAAPILEDCDIRDNAKPNALHAGLPVIVRDAPPGLELPLPASDGSAWVLSVPLSSSIERLFSHRPDRPAATDLADAIMQLVPEALDGGLEVAIAGEELQVRASDPQSLAAARGAIGKALAAASRLRQEVDRVQLLAAVESLEGEP